jgi:hypothetical protein
MWVKSFSKASLIEEYRINRLSLYGIRKGSVDLSDFYAVLYSYVADGQKR